MTGNFGQVVPSNTSSIPGPNAGLSHSSRGGRSILSVHKLMLWGLLVMVGGLVWVV